VAAGLGREATRLHVLLLVLREAGVGDALDVPSIAVEVEHRPAPARLADTVHDALDLLVEVARSAQARRNAEKMAELLIVAPDLGLERFALGDVAHHEQQQSSAAGRGEARGRFDRHLRPTRTPELTAHRLDALSPIEPARESSELLGAEARREIADRRPRHLPRIAPRDDGESAIGFDDRSILRIEEDDAVGRA